MKKSSATGTHESFYARRETAMRRKRTEVQRLLENDFSLAYNDVEKILDTYFDPDFLPNWYFHSNSAAEIANHICIITQLLNARTDYLRQVSADGRGITYFINIGRDFPGKMLALVEENSDMGILSYDTVLTRSGIRIVTLERRGRSRFETTESEEREIEALLDEVREYGRKERYRHTERFLASLPPNYLNEEINALTYPRRILRHLELFEAASSTDGYAVRHQNTEWEVDDENEKLERREQRLAVACADPDRRFVASVLEPLKRAGINMNRSYFDTFEHPDESHPVSVLSIYLNPEVDVKAVVRELTGKTAATEGARRTGRTSGSHPGNRAAVLLRELASYGALDDRGAELIGELADIAAGASDRRGDTGSGAARLVDELARSFDAAALSGITPGDRVMRLLLASGSFDEFWVEHELDRSKHNTEGFRLEHQCARGPCFGEITNTASIDLAGVVARSIETGWSTAHAGVLFGSGGAGFRIDPERFTPDSLDYYDALTSIGRELFITRGPSGFVAGAGEGCGERELDIMFEGFKSALRDLATMAYGIKHGVGFIGNHVISGEQARRILRSSFGIDHHDGRVLKELVGSERYIELVAATRFATPRRPLDDDTAPTSFYAFALLAANLHLDGEWKTGEPIDPETTKVITAATRVGSAALLEYRNAMEITSVDWELLERRAWPALLSGTTFAVSAGDTTGARRRLVAALERFGSRPAPTTETCDIHIAGPEAIVIDAEAASRIRAKIVVPVGLGRVTHEADQLFSKRGALVLPVTMTAAGTTVDAYLTWLGNLRDRARYEAETIRNATFDPSVLNRSIMSEFEARLQTLLTESRPAESTLGAALRRDIVFAAVNEGYRSARSAGCSLTTAAIAEAELRILAAKLASYEPRARDHFEQSLAEEAIGRLRLYRAHPEAVTRLGMLPNSPIAG